MTTDQDEEKGKAQQMLFKTDKLTMEANKEKEQWQIWTTTTCLP
jgi:hypothetical protein